MIFRSGVEEWLVSEGLEVKFFKNEYLYKNQAY